VTGALQQHNFIISAILCIVQTILSHHVRSYAFSVYPSDFYTVKMPSIVSRFCLRLTAPLIWLSRTKPRWDILYLRSFR